MGLPIVQTINSTGTSSAICMDWTLVPFNASFAVALVGNTTANFKIQYSLDDLNTVASPTWFDDANVGANTTGSSVGNYIAPVRFLRANTSAISSGGSFTFTVLQGLPV